MSAESSNMIARSKLRSSLFTLLDRTGAETFRFS